MRIQSGPVQFRWMRSLGLGVAALVLPLAATPILHADDSDNKAPAHELGHKQLSPEELLRLRILEAQSGARTNIAKAPKSQTVLGAELSAQEKLMQAFNRMSFGARPGEIQKASEAGYQVWIKQQLNPDAIDDSALDEEVAKRYPWTKMSLMDIKEKYNDDKEMRGTIYRGLAESVVFRAVNSNRQFKEMMVDFWRNHFAIDQPHNEEKSRSWTSVDYEENVIRKYAFGKFKMMLFASATHPAMLEYLDQQLSRAGEWNENYAREVMELHTVGADKGYTDRDVMELSKALTGWRYNKEYKFAFDKSWHQPGPKSWMRMTLPEGYAGGEKALYVLATSKATADFISLKLCRYLVNDNPSPALVAKVAAVFTSSDGDLPKVYAAILNSPDFISRENYRAKFKTPLQFCVSALRSTGATLESADATCQTISHMGEPLYECPDPTGYFDQAERWMDAGVLTKRWDYAWSLVRGGVHGAHIPDSTLEPYKAMKPEEIEEKMLQDLIGGDVGDHELKVLQEAAATSDTQRMLSIILGSPSYQQK